MMAKPLSQLFNKKSWIIYMFAMFLVLLSFSQNVSADDELSRDDFTDMNLDVKTLVPYHSGYPAVFTDSHSRFAYVLIHYEGTPNDDLYVLGTQIVIRSLKMTGSKQDIVIVCANNVREESKNIFKKEGARIKMVPNIPNPYKATQQKRRSYKSRFEFTFNKLYMWNLLEYERVMYMDADNLVTRNVDELFLCGQFCVTFFNPLYFHTGMMVIKPDAVKFKSLLTNLLTLASFSYDGADQGFLTAEFPKLDASPLFDPRSLLNVENPVPSEEETMRFNMEYNINSGFFYAHYSWDYYRRADLPLSHDGEGVLNNLPVYTLDYCLGPIIKPWNWVPFIYFFTVKYWDAVRMKDYDLNFVSLIPAMINICICLSIIVISKVFVRHGGPVYKITNKVVRTIFYHLPYKMTSITLGFITLIISIYFASSIPLITPPMYAWPIIFFYFLIVFYTLTNLFSILIADPDIHPDGSNPNHIYGDSFSELKPLFFNTGYFNVVAIGGDDEDDIGSLESASLNDETDSDFDDFEAGLDGDGDETEGKIAITAPDGYAPVSINKSRANRSLGRVVSPRGVCLYNGISANVMFMPMVVCVISIYVLVIANWHFHFVQKCLFLTLSFMALLGSYIYGFFRISLLAFDPLEVQDTITLER